MPSLSAMGYRPCGACRDLVPATTGCRHWFPGRQFAAEKKRRAKPIDPYSPEAVAAFNRMLDKQPSTTIE